MIYPEIDQDQIEKIDWPKPDQEVQSDRSVVRAAFWILLDNAIKSHERQRRSMIENAENSPEPDRRVATQNAKAWSGTISLVVSVDEEWLSISVLDQGTGVSEESLQGFSSPLDRTRRSHKFGSQILVYFAEQLGGKVDLKNRPDGRGAIASFMLPSPSFNNEIK
jgi:signal transduction histidine kinase